MKTEYAICATCGESIFRAKAEGRVWQHERLQVTYHRAVPALTKKTEGK